ncbi:thioredoxin [Streptomyces phage Wofford]|uniref:Thioredoxin n=1 Tax=Streptomyces phage Wofford TaxID=2283267 RepID=A0A345MA65_9CAUD|nr:thioredoxin [Streptomyces phage Wollford]AXH67386.1 thioredoxin [Streptomyces phage Wollford]
MIKVNNLHDLVSNTDKAVVVFSAPDWCVPCQRLQPHLEKLAEKLDYPVVYVDIDKAEEIRDEYGIMSVPRIFEFANGDPVRELTGRTVIALERELAAE